MNVTSEPCKMRVLDRSLVLLEYLCVFWSIQEARGPKAQVWRERKWCLFFFSPKSFVFYMHVNFCHDCMWGLFCSFLCFPSVVSTASRCVWNPLGHWRGTTMSEHFYMLREFICHFPLLDCIPLVQCPTSNRHFSPQNSIPSFLESVCLAVLCSRLSSDVSASESPALSTLQ